MTDLLTGLRTGSVRCRKEGVNVTTLRIGICKTDLTPQTPVPLAGFVHRKGQYESVASNIYARIAVFETVETDTSISSQGIIVTADLIWWGNELVERLQAECARRWGIGIERCLFHATHSHGGPQTATHLTPSLGEVDAAYIVWLEQRVIEGIQIAIQDLEPVTMERGETECEFAIHRRKLINGSIEMAPNPDETIDRQVSVISFLNATNKIKALLYHYACHPTTSDQNRLSSEFPGAAGKLLELQLGGNAVALFLQGFCGDVRPNLSIDGQFYRGTQDDIDRFGCQLAEAVTHVLNGPMRMISPSPLYGMVRQVELPFENVPSPKELEYSATQNEIYSEWASLLIEQRDQLRSSARAYLQYFSFSNELAFIAANGELVSAYGMWLKKRTKGIVLPVGYSNGMIGYVPTKRQLEEGGYESATSFRYFGLPGTFLEHIEEVIHSEFEWLLTKPCNAVVSHNEKDSSLPV